MKIKEFFAALAMSTPRYAATLIKMNNKGKDNNQPEIIKPVYHRPVVTGIRPIFGCM